MTTYKEIDQAMKTDENDELGKGLKKMLIIDQGGRTFEESGSYKGVSIFKGTNKYGVILFETGPFLPPGATYKVRCVSYTMRGIRNKITREFNGTYGLPNG